MKKKETRKESGSKLNRTVTVTVRLDPKLRYLADLAARKQRRTLSSFIEWAIEDSLSRVELIEGGNNYGEASINVKDVSETLWDVDESDRLCKLATSYPELLTHEEQRFWKLVKELNIAVTDEKAEKTWRLLLNNKPLEQAIRKLWNPLWQHLNGELDFPDLVIIMQETVEPLAHWEPKQAPLIASKQPSSPQSRPAQTVEYDDDIPF